MIVDILCQNIEHMVKLSVFTGQLQLRETTASHKLRDKASVLPDQYSPSSKDARGELLPDQ